MEHTFSQRHGLTPIKSIFQVDSMDEPLRNLLWNYCDDHFFMINRNYNESIIKTVWTQFLKRMNPCDYKLSYIEYRNSFRMGPWYHVYDFIEFLVMIKENVYSKKTIKADINRILESEMSGYRFVGDILVPITTQEEIQSIDEARSSDISSFHIDTALKYLSDRKTPDYRNSIKESISAVEAICRKITSESTLGAALNKIESRYGYLNGQFKTGLEKLYAYTNSPDTGIRHALLGDENLKFEDAKFMLVICSAFINYITEKSMKTE